jgi:mannosyltransferase OCH1-like enzyme
MSETWRLTYPNYTYVLWKDYDNLLLVERLYPQYLQTYLSLPQEIYRADFVRPLYMHAFGGIYVDLDTDSIESLEHTFHSSAPATNFSTIAYLAQMGTDTSFEHSIPNAFMASTPNHPFWPYLVQLSQIYAEAQLSSFASKVWDPEWVTGPVVLKKAVETYPNPVNGGELVVLPPNTVYPFDWEHAGERTNCLCHGLEKTFNRAKCRALLRPLGPSAVAYWNRSWGEKNILKLLFSGKG